MANQNVRHAAQAMLEHGQLAEFWTSVAVRHQSAWDFLLPRQLRAELRRRGFDQDVLSRTRSKPFLELCRLLALRTGFGRWTRHEAGFCSTDQVLRRLDRTVSKRVCSGRFDAVYGYEDGVSQSFQAAKACGVKCIYELPIGYWRLGRQLFEEEAHNLPEWAPTLEGLSDSEEKLARKDEEVRCADLVIVPSPFVGESLSLCKTLSAAVKVVPYGCPEAGPEPIRKPADRLRVLFVGSLGARKGLPYLLDAVKGQNMDLTLLGSKPSKAPPELNSALKHHRYLGSVPRSTVLHEMRTSDVFVLPTLFEGLALSLLEAMAQGLVPITTRNSGAAGLIRDGENGFLVPIRSSDAIREKLQILASDPDLLFEMRQAAWKTAQANDWRVYHRNLIAAIQESQGDGR